VSASTDDDLRGDEKTPVRKLSPREYESEMMNVSVGRFRVESLRLLDSMRIAMDKVGPILSVDIYRLFWNSPFRIEEGAISREYRQRAIAALDAFRRDGFCIFN